MTKKIPTLLFVSWGIGSAGMATMNLSKTLILRFMTDYLEIAATTAGIVFGISKIYDALTDPLMGRIADRHSMHAKNFNLFIVFGAIACPITYLLIFNVPSFSSNTLTTWYMLVMLLLFATAYTVFSVPYLSMTIDLTSHYQQRNFLLSFRAIGIAIGGLVGGLVAPLLLATFGRTQTGHELMSLVIAPFILIFLGFTYYASKNTPSKNINSLGQSPLALKLNLLKRNPHFCVLVSAKFVFFTGISAMSASAAYFAQYALEVTDIYIGLYYLCFFVFVILLQPIWLKLGKSYAKHTLFVALCFVLAVTNLTWLFSGPKEHLVLFILRSSLIGAFFGGIIVMGQSMLPDTIEFDMNTSGTNQKCLLTAIFSFAEKSSTALGIALVGLVLGLSGYIESSNAKLLSQPESAIHAIYFCFGVLPAIFLTTSAVLMKFYSLSEKQLTKFLTTDLISNQL